MSKLFKRLLCILSLLLAATPAVFAEGIGHEAVSQSLPVWSIIPFVGMLLSIAVIPLIHAHWWEHNMFRVAVGWSLLFLIPFAAMYGYGEATYRLLESILLDYIPFLVLLFGLFVVAGGIAIKGTLSLSLIHI